jgi:peptide/nickel transport system ATP-binding protein
MEKGRMVEQGFTNKVLRDPDHSYTQRLIAAVPRLAESSRPEELRREPVIEVENLCKTYRIDGGLFSKGRVVPAVQNVSFTLTRGRTLGVVGESGSGKSTLGRVLIKLTENDGGRILFSGRDIAPLSEAEFKPLRPHMQMIFQDPYASLNPRQLVGRALTAGPLALGQPKEQAHRRARELLEMVGLGARAFDRYPHEFSGGQRQRIGIARALMFQPDLIIADEAVSALDVSIQAQILELLNRIQQETHVSMIFITHDLRVASQICDDIAVMQRGKIVEYGPPAQIFRAPKHDYTRQLVAAIPGGDWH